MKHYQKLLAIIIIFLLHYNANAQVLTGIVCDIDSKQPIADVSIYLDGTSVGTSTNNSGKFELKTKYVINTKMILQHLSYETGVIYKPFDNLPDTLFLKKQMRTLREVSITGFTRAQMLKAFREQFLGQTKAGKSCTILNEDDIHFNIEQNKLFAYSDEPIVVVNDYLRYKIHFLLVEFWVQYGFGSIFNNARIYYMEDEAVHSSFFAGVSFFTDLAPDNKSIKKRRDNIYATTTNYFFKSLANNALKENKFIIFEQSLPVNPDKVFLITDTLSQKMVNVLPRVDTKSDTISNYNDSIAILNKMKTDSILNEMDERNRKKTDSLWQKRKTDYFNATGDTLKLVSGSISSRDAGTIDYSNKGKKNMSFNYYDQKFFRKISVLSKKHIQTDIYFQTDTFLVDRYGNFDKIDQIIFSGKMGDNRVGDMLPIDYEPSPPEIKQMMLTIQGSGTKTIYVSGADKMTIDWGDGSKSEEYTLPSINEKDWSFAQKCKYSHKYYVSGVYTITISGTNITRLNCFQINATSLDVSSNTDLEFLYCMMNQIKKLDVSNNTNLRQLMCFDNPLTEIVFKKNTALTTLWCGGNISSLDLSQCPALKDLNCIKNSSLTKLDLSKNDALVSLGCSQNKLTSLKISKKAELVRVDCGSNQLSTEALNSLFGMLHNKETSVEKSISIGNNPGTDYCNQSIATEKGWKVVATTGTGMGGIVPFK